ncbi:cell wall integrity and stress response component 2-like [Haliotis rufescens]|uniref:cell wall integrity and stress response component 2-like n=2 Tax=Haliotis TaxID=6452 RepID=UPI00201F6E61|nr:cell wall integrity and stress response component 2-like [Haliotis rufescens]XP_046342576.2 cell wall integrity and stress response component 2-like [Haliotis rufescens]XP_046342583.2 cell wall integrity and stress response component 2-like [Haliotis rufescens]
MKNLGMRLFRGHWVAVLLVVVLHVHVHWDVASAGNVTMWDNTTTSTSSHDSFVTAADERTIKHPDKTISGNESEIEIACTNCSGNMSDVDIEVNDTRVYTNDHNTTVTTSTTTAETSPATTSRMMTETTSKEVSNTNITESKPNIDNSSSVSHNATTESFDLFYENSTTNNSTSQAKKDKPVTRTKKPRPHMTKAQYEYLVRHFTGFMQHLRVGHATPNSLADPLDFDDGPFGSVLWRDKKYLVSVLIPIGVGITGAMLIIVTAYATRVCRRRKVAERNPRTLLQPSVSRPDDIMLLDQSSDDEF